MFSVSKGRLPDNALLKKYQSQSVESDFESYTDCYFIDVDGAIEFDKYIDEFYNSRLFKMERFLLSLLVSKPSTDLQPRLLALGKIDYFAAWTVEGRCNDQLLMCDYQAKTRSWFMLELIDSSRTRLYFGSAVVKGKSTGKTGSAFSLVFYMLLGFHKVYSQALLYFAKRALCS